MNHSQATWKIIMESTGFFDKEFYLLENPDVASSDFEPIVHFLKHGFSEGRRPNPEYNLESMKNDEEKVSNINNKLHKYIYESYYNYLNKTKEPIKRNNDIKPHIISNNNCKYVSDYSDLMKCNISPYGLIPPIKTNKDETILNSIKKSLDESAEYINSLQLSKKSKKEIEYFNFARLKYDNIKLNYISSLRNGFFDEILKAYLIYINNSDVVNYNKIDLMSFIEAVGVFPDFQQENYIDQNWIPILKNYNNARYETFLRFYPDKIEKRVDSFEENIKISILITLYNTPINYLEQAIYSILRQTYSNWELILVDDCSTNSGVLITARYFEALDKRIKVFESKSNGGISKASNIGLEGSTGDYIALMDHDDILTYDAIEAFVDEINVSGHFDVAYSDECKISSDGIVTDLFYKPDWSDVNMFNYHLLGHLTLYNAKVIKSVGGFRSEFDYSQDYDLALRVTEKFQDVRHIEKILYGWRMIPGSAAQGDKPFARETNINALQDAANRRKYNAKAVALPTANRLIWENDGSKKMSIVVPSDNYNNISMTVKSIIKNTDYKNYEILIVTNSNICSKLNGKFDPKILKLVPYDLPYNFSDKCNVGAQFATGENIVFFNDDVRVITSDWVEAISELLSLKDVGIVGPKLLYENGRIQHAGMITGVRRLVGTALHSYPHNDNSYFNIINSVREVSLICGACLAMRIEVFHELGGWDSVNAPISHSDVDLCFRAKNIGYKNVYTPHATLVHIGHASIGEVEKKAKATKKAISKDKSDIYLMKTWGTRLERDPFFTKSMRDILYVDSQEPFHFYSTPKEKNYKGKDVVLFSHDLSASGAPKIIYDIAKVMLEADNYVLVMSPVDGPFRDLLLDLGADVIVDTNLLYNHDAVKDLVKNFDLAICNTIVCWPLLDQFSNIIPTWLYVHESELINDFAKSSSKFIDTLKMYESKILVGSNRSKSILANHKIKSEILPYGVEDFEPRPREVNDLIKVSILATIEPRKGQDIGVEAISLLNNEMRSKINFLIAGRINDNNFAEAIKEKINNIPNVEFHNELTLTQYQIMLMDSDIIISPSRDDTLPLVSLNALSAGKQLIVSKENGVSFYIKDFVSGYVLDENSPEALCKKIIQVIENKHNWQNVAIEARNVYLDSFTSEVFKNNLLAKIGSIN